jgi:hypothetical protein
MTIPHWHSTQPFKLAHSRWQAKLELLNKMPRVDVAQLLRELSELDRLRREFVRLSTARWR